MGNNYYFDLDELLYFDRLECPPQLYAIAYCDDQGNVEEEIWFASLESRNCFAESNDIDIVNDELIYDVGMYAYDSDRESYVVHTPVLFGYVAQEA